MNHTQNSLLQGLSFSEEIGQDAFMTLYKWAEVEHLDPGHLLTSEGSTDQVSFFVLHGKIQITKMVNGRDMPVTVLGRGEWIDASSLIRQRAKPFSAKVLESSVVMIVTPAVLDTLNPEAQLAIFKYFTSYTVKRIDAMTNNLLALQAKNETLIDNLFRQRLQSKTDASESKVVQDIIKKIPRLPAFVRTLALNTLGDDYSPTQTANVIKQDPALVGMILKAINSPAFGFHSKISDIHRAIVLLGTDQVTQLLIADGVRKIMPDNPVFRELHLHTLAISQISFMIALKSENTNPAQVATFGLVHALGEAVIEYMREHNPSYAVFVNVLDSAQLGAMLFKEWDFPESLCRSVGYQFYPEFSQPRNIPADVLENVTICYLAHCCYAYFRGVHETRQLSPFFDDYLGVLRWRGLRLQQIIESHLMPEIQKRITSFPVALRKLFES